MSGVTPNSSLIQKADMALSDLTSAGGLEPEDAKKFIRLAIKKATLLKTLAMPTMNSPKKQLSKLRFGGRVLKPGKPGQALLSGDRSKPDLTEVELDTELFRAEVRLHDEILEDNIERGSLKNTVMQEMAKAVSRDWEDVVINGDTTSSDPTLAVLDGILKQITSHTVAAGGVSLDTETLRDVIKAMPIEFQGDKTQMKFWTSVNAEHDYRDAIANRMDAAGVRALGADARSAASVGYAGVEVKPIPLFPEDLGGGSNETAVVYTDPENVAVGVQRQIKMETGRDITSGQFIVVMNLRFDVKLVEETAAVKATGVTVS